MPTDARPPDGANPFDEIADEYEAWYSTPLGSFVVAEEEAALLDAVADESGHLLDVGAGTGWWSRVLARRGFSVTALEPSAPMRLVGAARGAAVGVPVRGGQGSDAPAAAQGSDALGAARGSVAPAAAVGPIAWVAGTADRLPAADGAFDVVVLMTVLEFLPGPEQALIEAWRAVRPGGLLMAGHLHALSPWAALYRSLADRGVSPWTRARFVEPGDLEAWLGRPADARRSCVFLAPGAQPPFEEADRAGRLAGNPGALAILSWRKPA